MDYRVTVNESRRATGKEETEFMNMIIHIITVNSDVWVVHRGSEERFEAPVAIKRFHPVGWVAILLLLQVSYDQYNEAFLTKTFTKNFYLYYIKIWIIK